MTEKQKEFEKAQRMLTYAREVYEAAQEIVRDCGNARAAELTEKLEGHELPNGTIIEAVGYDNGRFYAINNFGYKVAMP